VIRIWSISRNHRSFVAPQQDSYPEPWYALATMPTTVSVGPARPVGDLVEVGAARMAEDQEAVIASS
jgi:hypothetical protein